MKNEVKGWMDNFNLSAVFNVKMNDNKVVAEEVLQKPLSKKDVRLLNAKLVEKVKVEMEIIDSEILTLAIEESLNDISLKDLPPSKEELLDMEMVQIQENYQDALKSSVEKRVNGVLLPEIYDSEEGSVEWSTDSDEESED